MPTTSEYLNELVEQKRALANNLTAKGVTALETETFNSLVPKVLNISGGGITTNGIDKKSYSFGLLSDVHLKDTSMGQTDDTNSVAKFEKALNYYKKQDVDFIVINGDNLALNTRYPTAENPLTAAEIETSEKTWINEVMLMKSKIQAFTHCPIYTITGNHDVWALGYNEPWSDNVKGMGYVITTNDSNYSAYKGKTCEQIWRENIAELNFKFEKGNDVFIFHPMYYWNYANYCRASDITWLTNELNTYKDKRVFLFSHMPLSDIFEGLSYSGTGLLANPSTRAMAFKQLLEKYPNVIHISGHLHYDLSLEESLPNPNTHLLTGGAKIIRCSSGAYTRLPGSPYVNVKSGSQGYITDVYEDKAIFRGLDFANANETVTIDKAHYIVTV